jgi:Hemerythrin HHE cation binding domain
MNRYNIFYLVHKGLRALLYETALLIQQTDFSNAEETEISLTQLETVLELFDKHAHTEDILIFSAIEQYEPSVVDAFEQEHEKDHALGERLKEFSAAFVNAGTEDGKIILGKKINQAFIDFMVFNLEHMAKEEDIINSALWRYYTDAELHGITQKIVAAIPPPAMAQYSKWMMRGLSNSEITGWLKQVKNTAPDFVFQSLIKTAEDELTIHRLQLVQEALTEGAMIA